MIYSFRKVLTCSSLEFSVRMCTVRMDGYATNKKAREISKKVYMFITRNIL